MADRSHPAIVYDLPAVTATACQVPCQGPVATSWRESFPVCASAGAVSMLACGARYQLELPLSKPALVIRLTEGAAVVNVASALRALCPGPSAPVTGKC